LKSKIENDIQKIGKTVARQTIAKNPGVRMSVMKSRESNYGRTSNLKNASIKKPFRAVKDASGLPDEMNLENSIKSRKTNHFNNTSELKTLKKEAKELKELKDGKESFEDRLNSKLDNSMKKGADKSGELNIGKIDSFEDKLNSKLENSLKKESFEDKLTKRLFTSKSPKTSIKDQKQIRITKFRLESEAADDDMCEFEEEREKSPFNVKQKSKRPQNNSVGKRREVNEDKNINKDWRDVKDVREIKDKSSKFKNVGKVKERSMDDPNEYNLELNDENNLVINNPNTNKRPKVNPGSKSKYSK